MITKNNKYVYQHNRLEITRFNNDLDCIQKSFLYFCIPNGVNTFADTSNHFSEFLSDNSILQVSKRLLLAKACLSQPIFG